MASVRIYQKKQIRLDRLNTTQTQMFRIGNVGVASVKNRVMAAQGPNDGGARPLSRYYAIKKTRLHKGNRRNLMLTGDMLRNFQVRTVNEKQAKASNSTRKDREKAHANQRIEPWVVFSPKNREAVLKSANTIFRELVPRLAVERALGGKQS